MNVKYTQLSLKERREIEEGLDRGDSFRTIAALIGRSPSTISREVKENRTLKIGSSSKSPCRERTWCTKRTVCATCVSQGKLCVDCTLRDCRDSCSVYAAQSACEMINRAPWVCNSCNKYHYGCKRIKRFIYSAKAAHKASQERLSESRVGIDMTPEKAAVALAQIKEGLSRNLSPYEISVLYADKVGVHPSTIYRWVGAGYGGLSNIELARKVRFKPRKKVFVHRTTSHSKQRCYDEFLNLSEEVRCSRSELDCVIGRAVDKQAVMTLYNLPTHMQLGILLDVHDCTNVKRKLRAIVSLMPKSIAESWLSTVLTDNGEEFRDEDGIGLILGEKKTRGKRDTRLYYCDPRQSQQKGSCEKNHTELRQILTKGMLCFDELTGADMAVLMSHVNSNPRASLGGKTPIQMMRFIYGEKDTDTFLDALGIVEVERDSLMLKPAILDLERKKRGEDALTKLK